MQESTWDAVTRALVEAAQEEEAVGMNLPPYLQQATCSIEEDHQYQAPGSPTVVDLDPEGIVYSCANIR